MKAQDKKKRFIMLRAEEKSYTFIAKDLKISKSTCSKWEKQLEDAIAEKKADNLEQLYSYYYMTREARIQQLGDTLNNIENALLSADLTLIPPERLLDYKLKYVEALKEEYVGTSRGYALPGSDAANLQAKDLVAAFADLLARVRAGTVTEDQANRESMLLSNLLKAFDAVELQEKVDELEAAMMRERG